MRWSGLADVLSHNAVEMQSIGSCLYQFSCVFIVSCIMHRKYYSYFFVSKTKGLACPASGSTWSWFCQASGAEVKATQQAEFVILTFHPPLAVEPFNWHYLLCTLIWGLDPCISSSLLDDYINQSMSRPFIINRGLAAVNIANSGCP